MSWFTNFFSKSKKKVSVNNPEARNKEYKPFVAAAGYLGFFDDSVVLYNETFAKRSLLTGRYMHVYDFYRSEGKLSYSWNVKDSFDSFAEAYDAFCYLERRYLMNSSQFLSACKSLLLMFNKQYSFVTVLRSKTFIHDYPKYFRIVQLMLDYDLPVLVKADLYRQVSMFKKSVELLNNVHFNTPFERELCDEIRFRACNNIRHPFMIYDVDNLKEFFPDPNRPTYLDWFFYVCYEIPIGRITFRTAQDDEN